VIWRWGRRPRRGGGGGETARLLAHFDPPARLDRIVIHFPAVIRVEKLFEPLHKFKVLHVFSLDKLLDGNNFVDAVFIEAILQMFEVGDGISFKLRGEFDFLDGDGAGEKHIHELTINSARAQLFDFSEVHRETVIDPHEIIVSTESTGGDDRVIDVDGGHN